MLVDSTTSDQVHLVVSYGQFGERLIFFIALQIVYHAIALAVVGDQVSWLDQKTFAVRQALLYSLRAKYLIQCGVTGKLFDALGRNC